jgi:hypothetical protein
MNIMEDAKRRRLSELIEKANRGEPVSAVIEELIIKLDQAGKAEDVTTALEMLATLAHEPLYRDIRARMEANDHLHRQQWPMIG